MQLLVVHCKLRHLLGPCDPRSFNNLSQIRVVLNYFIQIFCPSFVGQRSSNSAQQLLHSVKEGLVALPSAPGSQGRQGIRQERRNGFRQAVVPLDSSREVEYFASVKVVPALHHVLLYCVRRSVLLLAVWALVRFSSHLPDVFFPKIVWAVMYTSIRARYIRAA